MTVSLMAMSTVTAIFNVASESSMATMANVGTALDHNRGCHTIMAKRMARSVASGESCAFARLEATLVALCISFTIASFLAVVEAFLLS